MHDFSKLFSDKTISVHIRSWNRQNEGSRHKLHNIKMFENTMKKYDKSYTFFIATDSQNVKNYFLNKSCLKNRILTFPRKTTLDNSRNFPEGVQEDLIELYLLSKNRILIGSHFSTFTEVAWWLGPDNMSVTVL